MQITSEQYSILSGAMEGEDPDMEGIEEIVIEPEDIEDFPL